MQIENRVAVVTGAAGGIGEAVAKELCRRGVSAIALVDLSERVHEVADEIRRAGGGAVGAPFVGDVADEAFRQSVFQAMRKDHGVPSICVPAAGITRDALSVKVDRQTGAAQIYPIAHFRVIAEINLIAPVYWALETIAAVAEDRRARGLGAWTCKEDVQGAVVLIGSVSSQGNKGQLSYAAAKAGLVGAASTLSQEAMFHGVRCVVVHPGFTDTPMVGALGEQHIADHVLPRTQLKRLIRPAEIADAIGFAIGNSAITGELWVDAGWRPGP